MRIFASVFARAIASVFVYVFASPFVAPAYAQPAPAVAPLVLRLPASPRAAALGNAWVAGRDLDVIFYNPAQLVGARPSLDLALTHASGGGTMTTIGSVYAAGRMSLTLGWGVQFVDFRTGGQFYPFTPDVLLAGDGRDALSLLATVGGAIVYKGFRIGAAGKYASDRIGQSSVAELSIVPVPRSVFLIDAGVAKNLWGGVAAAAVQNLRREREDDVVIASVAPVPRQLLAGWSTTRVAGPVDLGLYGQVTVRDGWTAPGGGIEVNYSWIEGYAVALRAGARRPESDVEHPFTFGAAFTADRVTVEYAVQFFEGGRAINGVTFRWR